MKHKHKNDQNGNVANVDNLRKTSNTKQNESNLGKTQVFENSKVQSTS